MQRSVLPPGRWRILKRNPDHDGRAYRIGEVEKPLTFLAMEKAFYDVGVFFNLDHNKSLLFLLGASCEAYLRSHVAKSYIRALFILILPHPEVAAQIVGNVFSEPPRTILRFIL